MEPATMQVSRYDFTLYNQAVEQARKRYYQHGDQEIFASECMRAYNRMMASPDTETVQVQTNAQVEQ
jgi:hypothetical protein